MDDMVSAEQARELLEAATPGRWDTYETFSATQDGYGISVDGDQRPVALLRVIDGGTEADRDLAAAAPDLAQTVVALHERVAAVEAERDGALAHAEELTQALRATQRARDAAAQAFDDLVATVWRAATGDEHEPPGSTGALVESVRALRSLRAAVLNTQVQDNSRVAGEPWRVQIFESEWDALQKLAGGER